MIELSLFVVKDYYQYLGIFVRFIFIIFVVVQFSRLVIVQSYGYFFELLVFLLGQVEIVFVIVQIYYMLFLVFI